MLTTERCLEAIRVHSLGLAAAAEGNFDEAVECCPGWDVSELVWHLMEVHYFWASIVEGLIEDPNEVPEIPRPDTEAELLAGFRQGVDRLTGILASATQSAPVWTWSHQKDVAFVTRHQVQEAAVHRWDAENAAGREFSIDPDIAADSIDEFLEHSTPGRYKEAVPMGGTLHIHATDIEGEWLLTEDDPETLRVERGHAKGDAALRGTASDLLLIMYRRYPVARGEIIGDAGVVERFLARTDLD